MVGAVEDCAVSYTNANITETEAFRGWVQSNTLYCGSFCSNDRAAATRVVPSAFANAAG